MSTCPAYGWNDDAIPYNLRFDAPCALRIVSDLKVKTILDVGCGNGALCGILEKQGLQVVGLDRDAEGIRLARETYKHVEFFQMSLDEHPGDLVKRYPNGFDAVISTEVVAHLYSPHELPALAKKCLKPEGYLIVATPYHGYLKNLLLSIADRWDVHHAPLWVGGHIKFWSRKTLAMLLEKSGFEVIGFRGAGRVAFLWKSMFLIARMPGDRS